MWSIYSVIVVLWLIYYSPIGTTSLPDDNKEFLDLLDTLASTTPKPGFLPPDDDREYLDLLGLLPSPTPKPDNELCLYIDTSTACEDPYTQSQCPTLCKTDTHAAWNGKACVMYNHVPATCLKHKIGTNLTAPYPWCYTDTRYGHWAYCDCPNMWFVKKHMCQKCYIHGNKSASALAAAEFSNIERPANAENYINQAYVALGEGSPVLTTSVFQANGGKFTPEKVGVVKACKLSVRAHAWTCSWTEDNSQWAWRDCKYKGMCLPVSILSNGHYMSNHIDCIWPET